MPYLFNMPGPVTATADEYSELEATLLNTSGDVPLAKRFRALFTLRGLKSHRAIEIIGQGESWTSEKGVG